MLERIKSALNSSVTWLIFLAGCVFYFWRKEKHLEDELREQKFDSSIKEIKDAQSKADSDADAVYAEYNRLRQDYLSGSSTGVRPGSTDSEKTN